MITTPMGAVNRGMRGTFHEQAHTLPPWVEPNRGAVSRRARGIC